MGALRDIRGEGWREGRRKLRYCFAELCPSLGELSRPWEEDEASDGGGSYSDKTAELSQWSEGRFRVLGRVFLLASGLVCCPFLVLCGASEEGLTKGGLGAFCRLSDRPRRQL